MKKLIAKTRIGTEYIHSKRNAFFASANAQKIVDILNENGYKLNDGEMWHVYDFDFSQESYVFERIYIAKGGAVKAARI